jgi:putative peptidoglycan lipid II flippase
LSIVAFPAIAAHATAQRRVQLIAEVAHALRLLLVLVIPICIGLTMFATPVVRLLFEHGKFTSTDTRGVALLIALYVGVILGAGLGDVFSRTLYALQDMWTPVLLSIVAFTIAAGLKFVLVRPYGAAGLVTATSFYYLLNSMLLTAVLLPRLSRDMLAGSAVALARAVASSLVACLAASAVMWLPTPLAVLPAAVCGALVYGVAMWLMQDEFALRLQRAVLRRAGA